MKILLAAINAKYIHSNLAVHSLRAYARRYMEETAVAEYTINQSVDEILMDLYTRRPDILCFSCYLWNISYVKQLIREIPKVLPGTKLWLGGPEVTYNAREMLQKYSCLSGILCGEGEETFLELMDWYHSDAETAADGSGRESERPVHAYQTALSDIRETDETQERWNSQSGNSQSGNLQSRNPQSRTLSEIRGIVFRAPDGRIVQTQPRPAMDLNRIPFVYEQIEAFRSRILYYESSRGCPFSCSYCLSSVDHCLRFRDIALVKRELQFFIDHEVPQVKFVDRTFNCRHDHAMAVWTYIREHDRGVTNFHFEIAADLLTEEEIALIRSMRPGLIQLEIGIQSVNSRTIREIRRKTNLEKAARAAELLRKNRNVHRHLDLIAGLPYEDYDSFAESFDRVYAMRPDQLQLGFLKVLKGSRMHEKAREYGLVYQERPPYEVLCTNWLSYPDVIRLKRIEEMTEVYYNSGQFRNTMEHAQKEFSGAFAMYSALADYYEKKDLFRVSHSRMARYEILYDFLKEQVQTSCSAAGLPANAFCSEAGLPENASASCLRAGGSDWPSESSRRLEEYAQWLILDLYLRDHAGNRPSFFPESRVTSQEAAAFYRQEEEERRYLKHYAGYDRKQLRRMTHLERIFGKLLLFDYRERDPLDGNARVYEIREKKTAGILK